MKKVIRPEDATFPYIVQDGSVGIKISKARNKGRDTYMISYSVAGKRKQVMCADFEKAYAKAKAIGKTVSHGRLNALEISSTDAIRFVEAKKELQPTGVSIEIAAKEYAQAWRLLGGKALLVEAAREYVKRHLDTIPIKTVQESVKEMLETKEREGASHEYRKILRLYLEQLAEAKPMLLRDLATSDVADFLRELKAGKDAAGNPKAATPRTKNNARGTVGAFFKFCKQRG